MCIFMPTLFNWTDEWRCDSPSEDADWNGWELKATDPKTQTSDHPKWRSQSLHLSVFEMWVYYIYKYCIHFIIIIKFINSSQNGADEANYYALAANAEGRWYLETGGKDVMMEPWERQSSNWKGYWCCYPTWHTKIKGMTRLKEGADRDDQFQFWNVFIFDRP